jgi:hypothetical protein
MTDWDEIEAEIAEENRKAYDALQTPEAIARTDAKRKAEFDLGVRSGWWDAEGNSLLNNKTDDDGDDEDGDL